MKPQSKNTIIEETPHDMMKRVFAVAELIVRSDGYLQAETILLPIAEKHRSEDLLYRKNHNDGLGNIDGTEEK